MNVGAVSAVGSGTAPVYALLSPYLNGVVRTSNAAAAAELQATAAATSAAATQTAIAARATAEAALTAAPPFANPAITAIAERTALGEGLSSTGAVTPNAQLAAQSLTGNTATTPLGAAAAADAAVGTTETTAATTATTTTTPATDTSQLNTPAATQPSPFAQTAYGDSGLLIQSYGAVALLSGTQVVPSVFAQPVTPLVTPAAPVPSVAALSKVA